jgi:hypothetical protein
MRKNKSALFNVQFICSIVPLHCTTSVLILEHITIQVIRSSICHHFVLSIGFCLLRNDSSIGVQIDAHFGFPSFRGIVQYRNQQELCTQTVPLTRRLMSLS